MTHTTRILAATLLLGLHGFTTSAQSTPPAPTVSVTLGEDITSGTNALTYHLPGYLPANPNIGSVALRISAPEAQARNTWVVVMGRAYLELKGPKLTDPRYIAEYNRLIANHPWLLKPAATTFGAQRAPGKPLSGLATRFNNAHLDALANVPLTIDPGTFAAVLTAASDPNNSNAVKEWGQPFLESQGSGGNYSFVWRSFCDHWGDTTISPSNVSNWYWASTYSRVREGDFATGKHLLNFNRIGEAIMTYQAGSMSAAVAFMQGPDYPMALSVGLSVSLQVISMRGPSDGGWGFTPWQVPGLHPLPGGSLPGISLTEPLVINPVLNGPSGTELPAPGVGFVYQLSPSSGLGLNPGYPAIVSLGQSPTVTIARFPKVGGGTVDAPLYPLFVGSGLVYLVVPSNATSGNVQWTTPWIPPLGVVTVTPSLWPAIGQPLISVDDAIPLP